MTPIFVAFGVCDEKLFVIEAPMHTENHTGYSIWVADGVPEGTLSQEKVINYMADHVDEGYSIMGTLQKCLDELNEKKSIAYSYTNQKFIR